MKRVHWLHAEVAKVWFYTVLQSQFKLVELAVIFKIVLQMHC